MEAISFGGRRVRGFALGQPALPSFGLITVTNTMQVPVQPGHRYQVTTHSSVPFTQLTQLDPNLTADIAAMDAVYTQAGFQVVSSTMPDPNTRVTVFSYMGPATTITMPQTISIANGAATTSIDPFVDLGGGFLPGPDIVHCPDGSIHPAGQCPQPSGLSTGAIVGISLAAVAVVGIGVWLAMR